VVERLGRLAARSHLARTGCQRLDRAAAPPVSVSPYPRMTMDEFDAWMAYLFQRPPEEPESEWLNRYAEHDSPAAAAERIRRLFGDAGNLLRPYTDDQVAHGLDVIVNASFGGEIAALTDRRVPVRLRTTGLRAIVTLFAEVFAVRLRGEGLPTQTPLERVCFMFWDVAALGHGEEDTTLDVLEDILALDSVPCQWAALHGLGHLHFRTPEHVPAIVDRWLERHPDAPQPLREYAAAARTGMVN
jgi:hypothetical protein